ncbi:SDR family NAD(P)-dependent oxidoreductase [Acidicapsa ligni]|uniref:SDR family NAD(P)-dependent oxidoreductase n=1 Tax=Acidicapsa ligni TaxID=542300 RepID=UPI0021DFF3CD|nr:SDR family oxidoreductase [Acidicapsa ligni]
MSHRSSPHCSSPPDSQIGQPLSGKTALVTGGAKRVGRELALELARAGANVVITFRESADEAADTVRELEKTGVRSFAVQADVRSEESVRRAVADTVDLFGGLDLLVNNAAVFESAPFSEITLDQWDRVFETNTRGPFLMAREALPHLKAARGRIVNLGSLGGIHAWATHAHYCSSKAALHMLTQTMAKAFAPEVSVNCIAPGWIEMGNADELASRFAAKTPMGRNGAAQDVAEALLFFATGPHFITGQILAVDGGLGL